MSTHNRYTSYISGCVPAHTITPGIIYRHVNDTLDTFTHVHSQYMYEYTQPVELRQQ